MLHYYSNYITTLYNRASYVAKIQLIRPIIKSKIVSHLVVPAYKTEILIKLSAYSLGIQSIILKFLKFVYDGQR